MSTVSSDDIFESDLVERQLRNLIPHCMALHMMKWEASEYLGQKFNIPVSWSNAVWDAVEVERRNALWLYNKMQWDQQSLHPQLRTYTYNDNTQHLNAPHMGRGQQQPPLMGGRYPQQPPALQDQEMGRGRGRGRGRHYQQLPYH